MQVRVRLFAALRERAGSGSVELDLPEEAVVADVWPLLGLGDEPPGLLFARNRAYAERSDALAPGDEVAVIPPVSGGADNASGSVPQGRFLLSAAPLSLEAVVDEVRTETSGAIATFAGTTRRHSRGREVLYLEYEAYEGMAEQVMADLASKLRARY